MDGWEWFSKLLGGASLLFTAFVGYIYNNDKNNRVESEKEIKDRIRTHEIRHEELEKVVQINNTRIIDSLHDVRNKYVSREEHMRSLDRLDTRIDAGFTKVVLDIRQILNDLGVTKK